MTTENAETNSNAASDTTPSGESSGSATPDVAVFTLKVIVDASGLRAGSRWRCERFDGSSDHLSLTINTHLSRAALAKAAKQKCWCGQALAFSLEG